ncbi:hypothetical protein KKA02_01620, partial [Patescibacteria group bacterium]|nr:hypothetical protein [Patescibacteria group bacterium]
EQHGFVLRDENKEGNVLVAYVDMRNGVISTKPWSANEIADFGKCAEFLSQERTMEEIWDIVDMFGRQIPVAMGDGVPVMARVTGADDESFNIQFSESVNTYPVPTKEILIMAHLMTEVQRSDAFGLAAEINGDDARKGDYSLLFRFASGEWLSKKDYDRVKELLKH